jgi:carbon starvation protein
MNVLVFLGLAAAAFIIAGRFYARFIARRLGEDKSIPTPAVTYCDNRDFVPTKPHVVFAHHFSAIAGAGPILGPTMAFLYGFVPAWLWIVLGGIFIGAVHDFTTLFVSLREGGRSMAEVARRTLGVRGFNLFISFTLVMIVLVTSSFLSATSISLTSLWPLAKIGVKEGETFLKTVVQNGVPMGQIGGIASMSVIVITLCSPVLGWLIFKRGIKTILAYGLAAGVCVASVLLGIAFPVSMTPSTWMIVISVYVLIAAGTPVWVILQPRDFINVQILYGGILLMVFSLLRGGIGGLRVTGPSLNLAEGVKSLGLIWPMMFCMIACGAISGFHALVAGGTTPMPAKSASTPCSSNRSSRSAFCWPWGRRWASGITNRSSGRPSPGSSPTRSSVSPWPPANSSIAAWEFPSPWERCSASSWSKASWSRRLTRPSG